MVEIRRLTAGEARQWQDGLAAVLHDCVEGGASVSFMPPFSQEDAKAFFDKVADGVERGERILLAALEGGEVIGTVQIVHAAPPNQPHRADIAKLLVRRSARGRGAGEQLMRAAEEVSRQEGKTVLVLDTATGDPGERLYARLGWQRVGVIPKYALYPDGRWCDTTVFWKEVT